MVSPSNAEYDVLIVGAGISGINAAHRIQSNLPESRYAILEAKDVLGGTWALFQYPGIRSDSDLFTFGFSWKPWGGKTAFASGEQIAAYLKEASEEQGIDKHIKYNHKVSTLSFSTKTGLWTVNVTANGSEKTLTSKFMIMGTGYYNYHEPLKVQIPGIDAFQGQVIHPQFWPKDLEYAGKKVVIIGSGATAITLLPNMAPAAGHITMLQRSPSYIMTIPNKAKVFPWWVPKPFQFAFKYVRYLVLPYIFFAFCRKFPNAARGLIRKATTKLLPETTPHDPHFNPRYNPWEQRLCMSPDGDFFECLRSGKASVATGTIQGMKDKTITLDSGETLEADIIVTATGLKLQFAGGCKILVDGKERRAGDSYFWRGVMLEDVPNCAFVIGYTNASWTLGADCTALVVCRLLKEMQQKGVRYVVPKTDGFEGMKENSVLNLNSTYISINAQELPKAGDTGPWQARSNYFQDKWFASFGDIKTGIQWVRT